MTELITVGEKGQIVIPKKMRDDFKIARGTKLLVSEDHDTIVLRPTNLTDKQLLLLLSQDSLQKVWDNPYDQRWDDVL